ncbi:MAG: penicillin acylase family protein [bacterium]
MNFRTMMLSTILPVLFWSAAATGSEPEEVSLSRLGARVEVRYDNFGIPHIRASSDYDLYFAQGYVQARDRLWQMDVARRKATGRLSEMFGKEHVDEDLDVYRTGVPQVSRRIWETSDAGMREVLQAFSDGVNALISDLDVLPEEYGRTGAAPAPWDPVDSIAIGRLMSWALSSDLGLELTLGAVVKTIGKSVFFDIAPMEGADPVTIVRWETSSSFPMEDFDGTAMESRRRPIFAAGRFFEPFPGSNNWVVSGARTENGFPLLSNDPHLGLSNPPIWYEVHLIGPGSNVIGSTFAGTPLVIIGHNERIAWGVTTVGYDVTDLYVEKPDPERPDTHYMYRGESLPFTEEKVEIKYVADGKMEVEERTILHTVHGPVVRDDRPEGAVISYRWTGHEPSYELRCFYLINRAGSLAGFKEALEYFEVGAQNFIYADVDGNIFYRATGKVPIRKGTPFLPMDGSSGDYEWTGYVPYDELPHAENPADGFVATANNRPVNREYPYYIGAFFDKGYRARRITDLIETGGKITFRKMQDIQADVHSLPGERLTPALLAAAAKRPDLLTDKAREALTVLKEWDFENGVDAIGSSIFHKWLKHCALEIFKDEFSGEILGELGNAEVIIPMLLRTKPLPIDFYDDKGTGDAVETKEEILVRALNNAVDELVKQFGPDMREWRWGRLHRLTLGHRLGGELNIGPVEVDGGIDTVDNAGFGLLGENFDFGGGPSLRMTVELKPGAARGENVIPGGQSADRKSPHYDDQFPLWMRNEAHAMLFRDEDIKNATEKTLILKPE